MKVSAQQPKPSPQPPTILDAFPLTAKELVDLRQGIPIIRKGQ